MSLTPHNAPDRDPGVSTAPFALHPPETVAQGQWQRRLLAICFAFIALEVGLFLMIFPWMDSWNLNYFPVEFPSIQDFWDDPYFRGALTGLGLLNVYVAILKIIRLFQGA